MILIIGFTCPRTIHFEFITKCDKCYYKMLQVLRTKCDDYNTKCDRTNHLSQPLLNGKRLFINENEFSRVLVSRALIFLVVNKILTASPWTTPMDYPYGQPLKWTSYVAGV